MYDFLWLANGKSFVLCGGHQPALISVYDCEGNVLSDLGKYKVNCISMSPDNRIACIAGFGNLKGDILFFDMQEYKLIGQAFLSYGGDLNWSPDSKYIIAGVLSPRLRVDNEFIIVSYNGEPIWEEKFKEEVFEVKWMENKSLSKETFKIEVNPNLSKKSESTKELESVFSSISLNADLAPKSSKPFGFSKK